ncbi:MAG: hypothetical protein MK078_12575 [Crocinitomicaceae bacterium]|nr:hypothetical protein [Crocinitomicaceae bacterium]
MEINIQDILSKIDYEAYHGDKNLVVNEIKSLNQEISKHSIFWCSDKYIESALSHTEGLVIVSKSSAEVFLSKDRHPNLLVVQNPRLTFQKVLAEFFAPKIAYGVIAKSAHIHESCEYNETNIYLGENVVIEEGVTLGDNVAIDHNTVIKSGTIIHNNVFIGANNTIGGGGFGYEKDENGDNVLIPHIGYVEIKNGVEIGNNVCIDRGVLGPTLIHENVKVDNLVHIAHGVEIGKNSLIIANSMIAGSAKIGENVWVSPSSSIIQKAEVGNDALVGMGSVVLKNVDESTIVAGVPAKNIKNKK